MSFYWHRKSLSKIFFSLITFKKVGVNVNFTLKGWYLKKYSLNNLYIVAKQYHLGENWQKAWLKKGWLVQGTGNEILRFYQSALF